jgi:multiple sugar transport system permease protein
MKMRTRQAKLGFITLKRPIVYTLLGTWSVICLLPIYWMTITSFKDVSSIDKPPTYVPLLDFMPSLDAWRFILFDANENLVSRAFNPLNLGHWRNAGLWLDAIYL